METATTTTITLRCGCGLIKTVSVTSDQMVYCRKCDHRLTGEHVIY